MRNRYRAVQAIGPHHSSSAGARRVLLLTTLLSAAAFIYGCAGPRPPAEEPALPEAFPHHTFEQIRHQLIATSDTVAAFTARANMSLRSPEQSGQFGAQIRARRGDSLFLTISPGLGIEAVRALVTPDSFFVYDRLKNRVMFGSSEDAARVLPEPFATEDLFLSLLGVLEPALSDAWSVDFDSAHYFLSDSAGRRRLTVDPARWRVVRYEERSDSGTLLEERVFTEFDTFDGVILPRRLVFRRPQEETNAMIYYRSIDVNPAELNFDLKVRGSADYVPVGRIEGSD